MLVKFKQAVSLCGKDYPRGTHEVPEDALAHKNFHRLMKADLVEDAEAAPKPVSSSMVDRQKAILERATAAAQKKLAAAQKPQASDPSQGPNAPAVVEGGDVTPPAPPAGSPAGKSDEELLADLEAEEATKKADAAKKNKQKK